jgi:4-hydroxy-3-methylbut-2-enyl diphosphate reductase
VVLVQSEQDVAALKISPDTPVAYVTQTTLSVDDTRGIIAALERRYHNIVGPEIRDICYATQNRQSAVRELSHHVDVILVVGAKNSSNSNRLREIGAEAGIPSYLIADGSELAPEWVKDANTIGITAGASAPEVLVEDVIDTLRTLGEVEVSTLPGRQEHIEFRLPRFSRKCASAPISSSRSCWGANATRSFSCSSRCFGAIWRASDAARSTIPIPFSIAG